MKEDLEFLNTHPRKQSSFGLDFLKSTFIGSGLGLAIRTLPLSYRTKNKELKEKAKREIAERLSREHTKKSLKKYFEGEINVRLTCYFNRRYDTTDVDNIAKFVLDCLKNLAFKDDNQIKELIVKKIRCGKNHNEYIGVKISKATNLL